MMRIRRKTGKTASIAICFALALVLCFALAACNRDCEFGFGIDVGKNGASVRFGNAKLSFDKDGRFSLNGNEEFIKDAKSVVCANGIIYDSSASKEVRFLKRAVSDEFGDGEVLEIRSAFDDGCLMTQEFFIYEENGFVLSRVSLESATLLSSNEMYPIFASAADGGKVRLSSKQSFVRVPYDNDGYAMYYNNSLSGACSDILSYEVGSVYCRTSGTALTVGSVEHDVFKSALSISIKDSVISEFRFRAGIADNNTRDVAEHGKISGNKISSPLVYISLNRDFHDGFDMFARACAKKTPPLKWDNGTIFGWNSWAAYGEKLTLEGVKAAADFIAENKQICGDTAYINFDAFGGYMTDEEYFQAVEYIRSKGLKVGGYSCPFNFWGDNLNEKVYGADGDYTYYDIVLKDENGIPIRREGSPYTLDLSHEAARQSMAYYFKSLLDRGVDYVKLDFVNYGALEGTHFDPSVQTGTQAYNLGMSTLKELADKKNTGRDVFISLSISPIFPSGYAHSRRISCDVFNNIGSTKYMLNSLTYGWWIDKNLYAFSDPDHISLYKTFHSYEIMQEVDELRAELEKTTDKSRAVELERTINEKLKRYEISTPAESRSRINSALITGTVTLLSDRMTDKDAAARVGEILSHKELMEIGGIGRTFKPLRAPEGAESSDVCYLDYNGKIFVAAFNFADTVKLMGISLSELNLSGKHEVKNLNNGESFSVKNTLSFKLGARDSYIFEITK